MSNMKKMKLQLMAILVLVCSHFYSYAQSGNGFYMSSMELGKIAYPSHTLSNVQTYTHYPVGIDFIGGTLYAAITDNFPVYYLATIDTTTGTITNIDDFSTSGLISGISEDPTTGTAYVSTETGNIYELNTSTVATTLVATISGASLMAIEFDHLGNLYGISNTGDLLQIDLTNQTSTSIGNMFPVLGAHIDLGYNPQTQTMYAAYYDAGAMKICTVDLTTGSITPVATTTDNNALTISFPEQTVPCDATIASVSPLCSNNASITLSAVTAGGTWSGTGITDANAGTFDPSVAGAGTHTITYALGCGSSDDEDITVNGVNVSTSVSGFTISSDESGATYQWLDCDDSYSILNGETAQDYTATANGNYAVEVTMNGCTDTSDCVLIQRVSLDEFENIEDVLLYPNPTKNNVILELGGNQGNYTVNIRTIEGKLVDSFESSKQQNVINLEELSGVYMIEIMLNNTRIIKKIVKE